MIYITPFVSLRWEYFYAQLHEMIRIPAAGQFSFSIFEEGSI